MLPAKAEDFSVQLDHAKLLRLPENVSTIVLGNPAVADATLQGGGLLVITGKGYGITNLIALNGQGKVIADHIIKVGAPQNGLVTVYRGVDRETLACAPRCERSMSLGDGKDYFDSAVGQAGVRNAASTGKEVPTGGGDKKDK